MEGHVITQEQQGSGVLRLHLSYTHRQGTQVIPHSGALHVLHKTEQDTAYLAQKPEKGTVVSA